MQLNEWYRVIAGEGKLEMIPDAVDYFQTQIEKAKEELNMKGNLERINNMLPGIVEYRFNQLQEINAILEYIEIQYNKTKTKTFKTLLETNSRTLSSRDAEKYAEADDNVISFALLRNEIALIRNNYLGIMKGLEQKSYSVSNTIKLRVAGLEDISL